MADTIKVVRSGMMEDFPPAAGMTRRMAVTDELAVVDLRIAPNTVPPWHHHGTRTVYAFVLSGTLRVEFGAGGRERVELEAGDFYIVPPETVHRESNLGTEEQTILGVLVGTGPTVVNVDGPQEV